MKLSDSDSYYQDILTENAEENYSQEELEQLLHVAVAPNVLLEEWNFYPFYNRIHCYMLQKLEHVAEKNQTISINRQICIDLSVQYATRFVWVSMRYLIAELHEQKENNMLSGTDAREEYNFFLEEYLTQTAYQRSFYQKYPAMTKLILDKVRGYGKGVEKLLCRLAQDKVQIEQQLCHGKVVCQIVDIKVGLSDEHWMGETTTRIIMDNGYTIYYKPHSLKQEISYQSICQWLGRVCGLEWEMRDILDCGDYGWEIEVKAKKCRDMEELQHYYTWTGIQLAMADVFSVSDLHFENFVAHGKYPVWIDLEFFPGLGANHSEKDEKSLDYLVANSVLQSGILPSTVWGNGRLHLGVLGNAISQRTTFRIPVVRAGKTSDIHIEYDYVDMSGGDCQPYETDSGLESWRFLPEILHGFEMAYRVMLERKEEFIELVHKEVTWKSRWLFRHTQQYRMYQISSAFPELMRNSLERRKFLLRMEKDLPKTGTINVDMEVSLESGEKLLSYETACIMQDIFPIYWVEDRKLCMGNESYIKGYFSWTLEEQFQRKHQALSERDLKFQKKLIAMAMLADVPADRQLPGNEMNEFPDRVMELLIEHAEWTAEGPDWLMLHYEKKKSEDDFGHCRTQETREWHIGGMDMYLYDGCCGVAVFLAAWQKVNQTNSCDGLLDAVVTRIHNYTKEVMEHSEKLQSRNTGIFQGEASVAYTYLLLYRICRKQGYLSNAILHAKVLTGMLEEDRRYDILEGNAGAIILMLQIYDLTGEKEMLTWAEYAGELLLMHSCSCKKGIGWKISETLPPLAGMAHGNSGIALALARLWKATGRSEYDTAVREALAYENTLFDEKSGNWMDMREEKRQDGPVAWCHGAAGILLARNEINRIYGEALISDLMLTNARRCVEKYENVSGEYCLCHGRIGRMLCNREFIDDKQLQNISLIPKEEYSFGLMTGLTGIGYGWMKLKGADLPDLLSME